MKDVTYSAMPDELNTFDFAILSQFGKVSAYRLESYEHGIAKYKIYVGYDKSVTYMKDNQTGFIAGPTEEKEEK